MRGFSYIEEFGTDYSCKCLSGKLGFEEFDASCFLIFDGADGEIHFLCGFGYSFSFNI